MVTDEPYHVAVIGLGSMGMGAARSCIAGGLRTFGIDPRREALDELAASGCAGVGQDGAEFAELLDAVVLLTVNAEQCRQALFGETGIAHRLRQGTPVMLSATVSAADARDIHAALAEMGLDMLDAPVSGGPVKAASGDMTVMAAGAPETFRKLQPVLDAVAAKVFVIGTDIGQGATVKIVHQLLAGVHIAVAAEAMAMAAKAGIPLDTMYEVVTNAAGNSWMFENRMPHVIAGDYTPRSSVDIFVKDLGLVVETGRALRFPVPLASLAHSMFVNASNAGLGGSDDSAVIRNYAGVDLPDRKP